MPSDFINTLLDSYLAALLAGLASNGLEAPDRSFVSHTAPPWDLGECETLAVWHGPIVQRQIVDGNACMVQPETLVCADLLRCVPTMDDQGNAPPASDLTDSAHALNRDVWVLQNLTYKFVAGDIGCEVKRLEPAVAFVPQGGIAGWRVCFAVSLTDPDPPQPPLS